MMISSYFFMLCHVLSPHSPFDPEVFVVVLSYDLDPYMLELVCPDCILSLQ